MWSAITRDIKKFLILNEIIYMPNIYYSTKTKFMFKPNSWINLPALEATQRCGAIHVEQIYGTNFQNHLHGK